MIDLGSRMAVIDNCEKASVAVFADLTNKLIRILEDHRKLKAKATEQVAVDPLDRLSKLGDLLKSGLLSQTEFDEAKRKILEAI